MDHFADLFSFYFFISWIHLFVLAWLRTLPDSSSLLYFGATKASTEHADLSLWHDDRIALRSCSGARIWIDRAGVCQASRCLVALEFGILSNIFVFSWISGQSKPKANFQLIKAQTQIPVDFAEFFRDKKNWKRSQISTQCSAFLTIWAWNFAALLNVCGYI